MVSAVRARIREIGGPPNQAAARILFELVNEEDEYSDGFLVDNDNEFETLAASFENLDPAASFEQKDTPNTEEENQNLDFN